MKRVSLLRMGLVLLLGLTVACSAVAPRSMLPPLPRGPSDDRPAWLRDLPQPLERHPAPQGWGGDHLAAVQIDLSAG
jgi:hypothetical protein